MKTSSFRLLLASAVDLSTLSPTDVGAIQTVAERRIPREPECLRCRIVIGPPRIIGADDGPGSLEGAVWSGARDSKGNYYLVAGPSQPPCPQISITSSPV